MILATCGLTLLAGCGSTAEPAPITERDRGGKSRVVSPSSTIGEYRVRPGDTLYGIAFDLGLDYRELAAWNGIRDPDRILAGAILKLRPPVSAGGKALPTAQQEPPPASWLWPVRGKVIASFSEADGRKGIDIAAPHGTPIQASATGRVVYAGNGLRGYGKLVIIRHSKSLLSAYAHQSQILVREGEQITQGQKIGAVGDTGAARAMLHFEIREFGRPVNPNEYLPS